MLTSPKIVDVDERARDDPAATRSAPQLVRQFELERTAVGHLSEVVELAHIVERLLDPACYCAFQCSGDPRRQRLAVQLRKQSAAVTRLTQSLYSSSRRVIWAVSRRQFTLVSDAKAKGALLALSRP